MFPKITPNGFPLRIPLTTIVFLLSLMLIRKLFLGFFAMKFVQDCKDQVSLDALLASREFRISVHNLEEEFLVLILNKHALDITLNWLCNTEEMKNVHAKVLIITLDHDTELMLEKFWPKIKRFHWMVPCLQKSFNYGEGPYQLFYLLRANLALAFLDMDKSFWMIQQDTFWRINLLHLNLSQAAQNWDILFDRAEDGVGTLIAGGYYHARPTVEGKKFFHHLSTDLKRWYAPDNTMMTSYCAFHSINCGYIPYRHSEWNFPSIFSIITNWKWLHYRDQSTIESDFGPALIQFDGDTKLDGKLAKMRNIGFYFLQQDGKTCNKTAVELAKLLVEKRQATNVCRSWSQVQNLLYAHIYIAMSKFPLTNFILKKFVLPYAHYWMLTI